MKREKRKGLGENDAVYLKQEECINCSCPTQPQELSLRIEYISVNKNPLEWHCFSLCRFFFLPWGQQVVLLAFFSLSTRYIIPFKCLCVFINRAKMSERGAALGRLKACTEAMNQRRSI